MEYKTVEIQTVLLSLVPAVGFLLVQSLVKQLIDDDFNTILYALVILILLASINAVGYKLTEKLAKFEVYWRSLLIVNVFLFGYLLAFQSTYIHFNAFGTYLMVLSTFHLGEYVATALFNYKELKLDSFLLNHSFEYKVAVVSSWCEYLIEVYLWPEMKCCWLMHYLGLTVAIFGDGVRKYAMYTAGTNFNHLVQSKKSDNHVLVSTGIYSYVRHPSYFGWYYWTIGSQILLTNPICAIGFAYVSWRFFNARMYEEEYYLVRFFGVEYQKYQKKVRSGIPFVKGYVTPKLLDADLEDEDSNDESGVTLVRKNDKN